jgi:hypothetical protein
MTEFVLRLDLAEHGHPDNAAAQYVFVRQMLDIARQQLGSGTPPKGELSIPVFDPSSNSGRRAVVGRWEFQD